MTTTILFTLTMPGNNSWNGRWSGDGQSYCKTRKFSGKKGAEKATKITAIRLDDRFHHRAWRYLHRSAETRARNGVKQSALLNPNP